LKQLVSRLMPRKEGHRFNVQGSGEKIHRSDFLHSPA
ncbi:hypothetical protein EVA_13472, partial [gut metagenome]